MILEEFGFMISLSFIYAFEYFSVVFGFVFSGFKYSGVRSWFWIILRSYRRRDKRFFF